MAGCSLADIADLLGHKDLATTQIYAKVQQEHLRSVVGKLTGLVPSSGTDVSLKCVTQGSQQESEDRKLLPSERLKERKKGMAERVSTVFYVPMCSIYFPHVTHKIL